MPVSANKPRLPSAFPLSLARALVIAVQRACLRGSAAPATALRGSAVVATTLTGTATVATTLSGAAEGCSP